MGACVRIGSILMLTGIALGQQDVAAQSPYRWALPKDTVQPTALFARADVLAGIVSRIDPWDAFFPRCDTSGWCWGQEERGTPGYLSRDALLFLDELPDSALAAWMLRVFAEEKRLGKELTRAWEQGDSLRQQEIGAIANDHDMTHIAALAMFRDYFCRSGDQTIMRALMENIAANPGSANEMLPTTLVSGLSCRERVVLSMFKRFRADDRAIIEAALSAGIGISFNERDPVEKAEQERLRRLLE